MNDSRRIAAACMETTLDTVEDIIASRIKMWRDKPMLEIADVITHANRITELETVMDEIRLLKRAAKRAINEA